VGPWLRALAGPGLGLALAACATVTPGLGDGRSQTHVLGGAVPAGVTSGTGPVLLVAPPGVRPGLDSTRMAYVERAYELGYFGRNQWADTPARMLSPLLVRSLEGSGSFRAVVASPSPALAGLRLETELLALQQEFLTRPSVGRLALRAQLVDLPGRQVIATGVFEAAEPAPSDDPYGGVVALNRALERVLAELTEFVTRHSR
jgi:cholesterol transport system auxiliary component